MDYISHHGIRGQQWGVKNGPPYPLKGGSYSTTEMKELKKARRNKYSRYNKAHFDTVIEEGTKLRTLARDPKRTQNTDMFYASYTKADNDRYNMLFNHKTPNTIYDKSGNPIGTGAIYKYAVYNKAKSSMKVASRDSGAKTMARLYENDRDFYNFLKDPDRCEGYLKNIHSPVKKDKYKKTFKKLRENEDAMTDKDVANLYDMVNCVIPTTNKDVVTQRAKLFRELKKDGYNAVLDINDAITHPLAAQAPVIVFDMEPIALDGVRHTTMSEVTKSKLLTTGRYALGIYDKK